MTPGIEDRRLLSTGDSDVREDVFSLVDALRCEDDLCGRSLSLSLSLCSRSLSRLSLSAFSADFDDSFFSRRLSGLLSLILEGIMVNGMLHDAQAGPLRIESVVVQGCRRLNGKWYYAAVGLTEKRFVEVEREQGA